MSIRGELAPGTARASTARPCDDVAGLVAAYPPISVVYGSLRLVVARLFKREARRGAALEIA